MDLDDGAATGRFAVSCFSNRSFAGHVFRLAGHWPDPEAVWLRV